jgi:hypothetical protein
VQVQPHATCGCATRYLVLWVRKDIQTKRQAAGALICICSNKRRGRLRKYLPEKAQYPRAFRAIFLQGFMNTAALIATPSRSIRAGRHSSAPAVLQPRASVTSL